MKRNLRIGIGLVGSIGIIEIIIGILMLRHRIPFLGLHRTGSQTPVIVLQSTPSFEQPYPSEILDLTNWKVTLPIGKPKKPSSPLEIRQPELHMYKIEPWFTISPDGKGVVCRAPVIGPTTTNTNYSRSELREMTDNGMAPASWSSTSGIHTLLLDQAITSVPLKKRHIVAGQIHDDNDDILVIRLEYPKLYVNVDGKNVSTLDTNYTLGKRFTVKLVVQNGQTEVYYNDSTKPDFTLPLEYSDAYFKAGAYTQSNCEKEGDPSSCNEDNYGEVILYQVKATHTP